ncbi:MAG TPA: sensor domain-containing protein [Streptosporangiaceae bacterium]|nr:sensor domain-containing protein [Streptosporangiaceae bacterium]
MDEGRSVFGRLAQRTLQTCVRGIVQAIVAVAGVPLFIASLISLLSLAAGIGILLAPKSLLAVRGLARGQRRWAREWSRVSIAAPYRPRPVELTNGLIGRLQRCKWLLTDPATWRDLLWLLVNLPAGVVLGLLPAFLVVAGTWTLVADGGTLLFGWWNTAPPGFWGQVFFLSMLPLGVLLGPRLLKAHAQAAASLLAPTREAMAAQVGQLAESRSQAVDASAAELRRIERDLHDGAQARLVSLGMNIGFAEQVLRDNPDLALSLLAEARTSSGQALVELRTLVRGIHPPVLAERGLDGAVRALALSLPLPVDLHIDLAGRASAPVESALYFAIAEALANVIKHSGANRAWVQLEYDSGRLVAIVGDNGTGGAAPGPGGGLRGVERRLAAFDGVIAVTSPVGGPTLVTMELPCELSLART